ncbi:ABC transporter permease [Rathayibacter soli]|uniref:ABC transporter permease n=1 Tax=Rathayibacter soli TaxID=3144168 RepID=UPI0027E47D52|nr:ABC transporter permease [Glaciibacter superstes]
MNNFFAAFAWLVDPAHLVGADGIPARVGEHVGYTLLTLVIAAAIALPAGLAIGHTGHGKTIAVQLSGGLRSLPTLGLVTLLGVAIGIGLLPPLIALVILALPPILAGAYAGLEAVDRTIIDAARAVGMTEWQILITVEIPLAAPLIIGGIRSAALQVIATWTVAAILPLGGLGRYIYDAIPVLDYTQMLAGSILVTALALAVDGLFALIQKFVVPRGVVAGRVAEVRVKTSRRRPAAGAALSNNQSS